MNHTQCGQLLVASKHKKLVVKKISTCVLIHTTVGAIKIGFL